MRTIGFLMLGLGTLLVGCGSSDAGGNNPTPGPMPGPVAGDFCAAQHEEGDFVVCDALYEQAPLVHLPKSDGTHAYAALKADPVTNTSAFVTEDGTTYPY